MTWQILTRFRVVRWPLWAVALLVMVVEFGVYNPARRIGRAIVSELCHVPGEIRHQWGRFVEAVRRAERR